MLKDSRGRFWRPDRGFNNIPCWSLTEGYQVRLRADAAVSWQGDPIDPQADIPLERGWNLIPYYPDYNLSADSPDFTALSPILDHLLIAKNDAGNFMLPSQHFSNMPPWTTGKGYQ